MVDRLQTIGVTDPQTGDPVRTGDIVPDVAVDPASGALYAVWQDSRFSGGQFDSIAFSQSLDGGLTWSAPIKVNLTPGDQPAGDQQAFTASVHVTADGTIGSRTTTSATTPPAATLETDYFLVHCHPTSPTACADAANWGDEVQAQRHVVRHAPGTVRRNGFFTGDYEGLANVGTPSRRSSPSPTGPTPPAPSSGSSDSGRCGR